MKGHFVTKLIPPEDCATMTVLRQQIDAIDERLIGLLAARVGYIDRAVDLKRIEGLPARTVDRVAEVLAKVSERAASHGLDKNLAHMIWSEMIEWSIQREAKHLG